MNVADQNALQDRSHNTHKANILEKQCDSAMKINFSAIYYKINPLIKAHMSYITLNTYIKLLKQRWYP